MIYVTLEGPNGGFHASFMLDKEKIFNVMVIEHKGKFYLFDRNQSRPNGQVYVEIEAPFKTEEEK